MASPCYAPCTHTLYYSRRHHMYTCACSMFRHHPLYPPCVECPVLRVVRIGLLGGAPCSPAFGSMPTRSSSSSHGSASPELGPSRASAPHRTPSARSPPSRRPLSRRPRPLRVTSASRCPCPPCRRRHVRRCSTSGRHKCCCRRCYAALHHHECDHPQRLFRCRRSVNNPAQLAARAIASRPPPPAER